MRDDNPRSLRTRLQKNRLRKQRQTQHSLHMRSTIMRLRGVGDEAWRNILSGTTHTFAFALVLTCVIVALIGADTTSIMQIRTQANDYVAAGASTYTISLTDRINGATCDSLSSMDGVIASGAIRNSTDKLTFAALPSIGVPVYEITVGATSLFAHVDEGIPANSTVSSASTTESGIWLSQEASSPLQVEAHDDVPLADGRSAHIAGIYDWPDDGRKTGYGHAALLPVPMAIYNTSQSASAQTAFDQCWVKTWPVTDDIESLLQLTVIGDVSSNDRATISRINTTLGLTFDADALINILLRIPSAGCVGAVCGAGIASLPIRKSRLFTYFKAR